MQAYLEFELDTEDMSNAVGRWLRGGCRYLGEHLSLSDDEPKIVLLDALGKEVPGGVVKATIKTDNG